MKCASKVLVPVGAAVGIFVGYAHLSTLTNVGMPNWLMLGYLLIGAAVGALVSGILSCWCQKRCAQKECSAMKECCDTEKDCGDKAKSDCSSKKSCG